MPTLPTSVRLAFHPIALAAALAGLTGCGNDGKDGSPEPYAVGRSIALDGSATPLDVTSPESVLAAGSLAAALADELEDVVDDLDEWFANAAGSCRGGGNVAVQDAPAAGGGTTRTLTFTDCKRGDDRYDGVIGLIGAAP